MIPKTRKSCNRYLLVSSESENTSGFASSNSDGSGSKLVPGKKIKIQLDFASFGWYNTLAALSGFASGLSRPQERDSTREAGAREVKHAIIETGGKQYRVAEGDVIFVEKLNVEAGEAVKFDRVLAVIGEEGSVFGKPVIEGATVSASVVKNGKSKKVRVFKMKPKKGYRRTQGHRQPYTKVQIEAINA